MVQEVTKSGRGPEPEKRFEMGRLCATPGVLGEVDRATAMASLQRHARGDWGELDPEDKRANDDALVHGGRLVSAYRTASGTKFWIITEADRSATTLLLPEEY